MARLSVTPEILNIIQLLPCRVVGSCESEDYVCLRVEVDGHGHDDVVTARVERNFSAEPWTRITIMAA